MGKLGGFAYPDLTLNEAIELIRKIAEVGGTISPTGLARLISIDPRGAGLHSRIEDLKTYGFIETNGELKLSPSAHELLDGNMQRAWEAFWAIPLYAEMDRRLQGKEPADKVVLNNVLFNITKADANDIARRASRLKNNYMEAQPYRTGGKKPEIPKMESVQISSGSRLGEAQKSGSAVANPLSQFDSDFYLVDRRGTPLFLGIDSARKADFAISYLKDAKETLPGGPKHRTEKKPLSR